MAMGPRIQKAMDKSHQRSSTIDCEHGGGDAQTQNQTIRLLQVIQERRQSSDVRTQKKKETMQEYILLVQECEQSVESGGPETTRAFHGGTTMMVEERPDRMNVAVARRIALNYNKGHYALLFCVQVTGVDASMR